jgi:Domain of unknown function (DUF4331)
MSHHFDTTTARNDPRLNLTDLYLFSPAPGVTTMALTVNPGAGQTRPASLHEEGLYAFRFDLDGDAREDVAFKVGFGEVTPSGDGQGGVQRFEVRRTIGQDSESILSGETGRVSASEDGVKAFVGLAPDLFAGNRDGLHAFRAASGEGRFFPGAFENRENWFGDRNVTAIVLEVPNALVGEGTVHGWATVSLRGHAPETQVSRWGLPLITHLFLTDPDAQEAYNHSLPSDDAGLFASHIRRKTQDMTRLAGSSADPAGYAERLAARLCPTVLPYEVGTAGSFDYAGFNGRGLTDDVMDVMLTLMTNTALNDGAVPDASRIRPGFPYFGDPYPAPAADDRS